MLPPEPSEPGPSNLSSTTIPDLTNKIIRPNDWQYYEAGGFGDVYRCRYTSDDGIKEVAVKVFRFSFSVDDSEHNRDEEKAAHVIRRELGIWRRLSHRNIVPFLGVTYGFGRRGNASLVSPWMPHGTLHKFLKAHDSQLLVAHRLQLLLDIANGLHYLHSFPMVHGDLSSNNVLVDPNYNACLTDFGCASLLGELPSGFTYLKMSTAKLGTLRWAAPEHFLLDEDQRKHTSKSDIYSFGNIALLVLSGQPPWSEVLFDVAVVLCLSQSRRPSRPVTRPIDDQHWALIERCWSTIPERPLAKDVVSTLQQFLGTHSLPPLRNLLDVPPLPCSISEECVPRAPFSVPNFFMSDNYRGNASTPSSSPSIAASSTFGSYQTAHSHLGSIPPSPITELPVHRSDVTVHNIGLQMDCPVPRMLPQTTGLKLDDSKHHRIQRNIVFVGETGSGKSSTINLLLKTGPFAPISYDSQPCTQVSARYETTFDGAKYNLWDTRGLGPDHSLPRKLFGGEEDLKKFLKEIHRKLEVDLLVYCIRGSGVIETSREYYMRFRAISLSLSTPVALVVTRLEKDKDMEDWWSRNSVRLKELEMEFDDHVCITTLQGHPLLAESRAKLVVMITKNCRRELEHSGKSYHSDQSISRRASFDLESGLLPPTGSLAQRAVERTARKLKAPSSGPLASPLGEPSSDGRTGPPSRAGLNHEDGRMARHNLGTSSTVAVYDFELDRPSEGPRFEEPRFGRRIRGPIRASGGLVFGRELKACVNETAIDSISGALHALNLGLDGQEWPGISERIQQSLAPLESRRVPALVVRCTQHILVWGVQEQGLFRIRGRPSHVAKLRAQFDTGADFDIVQSTPDDLDPHAVTAVFKAYLRELPEPILTNQLTPYFDAATPSNNIHSLGKPPSLSTLGMPNFGGFHPPSESLRKTLSTLISRLPQENRDLLFTITEIINHVAEGSSKTKMPLSNLLLVFYPSLNMNPSLLRALCESKGIWNSVQQSLDDLD